MYGDFFFSAVFLGRASVILMYVSFALGGGVFISSCFSVFFRFPMRCLGVFLVAMEFGAFRSGSIFRWDGALLVACGRVFWFFTFFFFFLFYCVILLWFGRGPRVL